MYNEFNPDPKLIPIFDNVRISKSAISRIYDKYGSNAYNLIKQDPYRLIDDIYGIAFLTADAIASSLGISKSSDTRVQAGIAYILKYAIVNDGHTCLPFNDLVTMTNDLLELELSPVIAQVDFMLKSGVLITINDLIYDRSFYESEKYVGEKLRSLLNVDTTKDNVQYNDYGLADDQVEAVHKVLDNNVFILTGAPGTGKTYTIRFILELLSGTVKCQVCKGSGKTENPGLEYGVCECSSCNGTGYISRIKLAAPTGKAAKRMYEQTGMQASTIHKLLEPIFNSRTKRFEFTRNETNPIDADTIILDEISMMDIKLTELFLRAVSPRTRLIMIGDIYQLPPVGAGYVLRDMIQSGVIPCEELTIIKRQDAGLIIDNCHAIKNGQDIQYNSPYNETDFSFVSIEEIDHMKEYIYKYCNEASNRNIDILRDIQVITPLRLRTELGCKELNEYLQSKLNPNPPIKINKKQYYSLRVGDKVIQTKNNYAKGIMNGDMGYIQNIDTYTKTIKVRFDTNKILHKWDSDLPEDEILKQIEEYRAKQKAKLKSEVKISDYMEDPNYYDDFYNIDGSPIKLKEIEEEKIITIPMYGKDNNLMLAYAITCHKYQGSENKIIIIPIHRCFGSKIMQRNWLYTAISRASELCILIGDKSQIPIIINRNYQIKRFTNLQEFLKGE